MQRRDAVDGLKAASCGHHIEAVSAVAGNMEVVFMVAIFHHNNEPSPSMSQVVTRHTFTSLLKKKKQTITVMI